MKKPEFCDTYCELIAYYQCIESDLKGLCATLFENEEKNWFERLEDYEFDPLGKMIQKIRAYQEHEQVEIFSAEDFITLDSIRRSRNLWVHQCFVAPSHVTFHKGNNEMKNPAFGEKIKNDLRIAIEWDEKITEINRSYKPNPPKEHY